MNPDPDRKLLSHESSLVSGLDASAPKVSIILPAYNAEKYIAQSIESVLRQDFSDFELIIVDDGSRDSTLAICQTYTDPRIRCVQQVNQGSSAARNHGLRLARGRYIAFLDADDVYCDGFLSNCVRVLDTSPTVDVVCAGWQWVDSELKPLPAPPHLALLEDDLVKQLLLGNPFAVPAMMLRKECFAECGGFDESLVSGEDTDLWLRLALFGKRFHAIEETLVHVRLHTSNKTVTNRKRNSVTRIKMIKKVWAEYRLPPLLQSMKPVSFAKVYFDSCLQMLWDEDITEAQRFFREAVIYHPSILKEISTYYDLACSTQTPGYQGTRYKLDLIEGERRLKLLLESLPFDALDLGVSPATVRRQVFAYSYLALGMAYYGLYEDMSRARRCLWKSLVLYPFGDSGRKAMLFLVRALLGRKTVLKLKSRLPLQRG